MLKTFLCWMLVVLFVKLCFLRFLLLIVLCTFFPLGLDALRFCFWVCIHFLPFFLRTLLGTLTLAWISPSCLCGWCLSSMCFQVTLTQSGELGICSRVIYAPCHYTIQCSIASWTRKQAFIKGCRENASLWYFPTPRGSAFPLCFNLCPQCQWVHCNDSQTDLG